MEVIIAFFIAHWYLSLFFQTFFLHRYASHRAFTMNKFTEKVFFVLTWIFQGSNYLSPYGYGIMHRMHHAFADTPNDPHSPKYDESIFKMMWKTKTIYSEFASKRVKPDPRFTKDVPEWDWFDRFARSWPSRIFWGGMYVGVYWMFADVWWLWLLLPIQFAFAHKYGYRNFEVKDTSRNFLPFDFLMMGESYHNNHHRYGSRPNFGGIRWHELDPTYQVIKLLDKLNVIKLRGKKAVNMVAVEKKAA